MSNTPSYVLDSYALVVYFNGIAGGVKVGNLIGVARRQEANLYMSVINAGELFYLGYRSRSLRQAESMIRDLRSLPISVCGATDERVFAAARLKAKRKMSYADCFAVALAQELNATIVTGDPEFRDVESLVTVTWLP
jgi:ribonuclease VapC